MDSARAADHAMGLELQLEELFDRRQRALVQHRPDDVRRLDAEIAEMQSELAATAELLTGTDGPGPASVWQRGQGFDER